MTETFSIPAITDAHVHLRQGWLAEKVTPYTARVCGHAIVMPNTNPPLHDPGTVEEAGVVYQHLAGEGCKIHLTAKLLPRTTPDDVRRLAGKVLGFKLYPSGVTTNSDDGIPWQWFDRMPPQFVATVREIAQLGLVLMQHGEHPREFCLDREKGYLKFFRRLSRMFPDLRMTLEHVTSEEGVEAVQELHDAGAQVLGTITLHHLELTLDDVVGDKLRPDHFCKPLAKRSSDRLALLRKALYAEPAFAMGSDSAPHCESAKYCAESCAGVFAAPVLLERLVQLFKDKGSLHRLKAFCCDNANHFYGFDTPERVIELERVSWKVPNNCGGEGPEGRIVPYLAGQEIGWRVKDTPCSLTDAGKWTL